jgi:branched-chain amino acid transport system ATP-binding protein
MSLEVEDLNVRYGRVHAVRGASLTVGDGEIVAVLGANGAGKSSLLKAVLGLVPSESGRVRLAGMEVTGWPPARRLAHGLALVPEGRRILVGLTVEENLLMGAYARRDADAVRAEIAEVYERFPNLAARRHLPAAVLSGGEQQMLAIGRGLLARPRLMMLDEPSLGLSPLLVQELFLLLRKLHRDGLALLLVEQNTTMALAVAARVYVMELGRVVTHGAPRELLADDRLRAAYLGGNRRAPRGEAAARSA